MQIRLLMPGVLVACLIATPALAQTRSSQVQAGQKPATPPRPKLPLGVRAFFAAESESLRASSTFKALTGSSTMTAFGGGGEILNLLKRVFVRVGMTSGSRDGERAFVIDGQVVSTGVPMTIDLRTFELAGGWRMELGPGSNPAAPVKPPARPRYAIYFGAGLLSTRLSETSTFAGPGDDDENSFKGYSVFGGLDAAIWSRFGASLEAQYRTVPDALGDGGVSQAFGETNLGGVVVRGLISFRVR